MLAFGRVCRDSIFAHISDISPAFAIATAATVAFALQKFVSGTQCVCLLSRTTFQIICNDWQCLVCASLTSYYLSLVVVAVKISILAHCKSERRS